MDLEAVHAETTRLSNWAHLATVGAVHTDLDTRRRLWTGVFTFNRDSDDFAPEGLESPDNCFVAVEPARALALKQYSIAGRDTWRRA